MDIADLTNQMLLLDCDEKDEKQDGFRLSARVAVAGWCLLLGCLSWEGKR